MHWLKQKKLKAWFRGLLRHLARKWAYLQLPVPELLVANLFVAFALSHEGIWNRRRHVIYSDILERW